MPNMQENKEPNEEPKDPKPKDDGTDVKKAADDYLKNLQGKAGKPIEEKQPDDHEALVKALAQQELMSAKLDVISNAYVDLLKKSVSVDSGDSQQEVNLTDIIKQSRKASGTYYKE